MFRLLILVTIFFFVSSISVVFGQVDSIITYHQNGQIESIIPLYNGVREGEAKFFNQDGMLIEEVNYLNGRVEGLVKIYSDLGFLKEMFSIEEGKREGPTSLFDSVGIYFGDKDFLSGRLVIKLDEPIIDEKEKVYAESDTPPVTESKVVKKNTSTTKQNTTATLPAENYEDNLEDDPAYFISVEVTPEPVGGFESIQKRVYYPELAKKNKIQGIVKIRAYIDRYGDVEKTEIVEGIGYGCDEAAEITVYYTKFTPGLIKGKPVKVQLIVPIEFKPD
ncbi:MAG: TonB family protein [Ignavibacteria bacterium]|jgi:TonB family protein|nr:TonB family protein [Ignavibacteria bacterium]